MSFVKGLKRLYENEIEVLGEEYNKYAKKMLAEQFDIDTIQSDLELIIEDLSFW